MKFSDLEFALKSFSIEENGRKCIKLPNNGLFDIVLSDTVDGKFNVCMHNTSGIEAYNPIEDFNYWMKKFDCLECAKKFAKECYESVMNKLFEDISNILEDVEISMRGEN